MNTQTTEALNKAGKKAIKAVYALRPNLKSVTFIRSLNKMLNAWQRGELSIDNLVKRIDARMRNLGIRDENE